MSLTDNPIVGMIVIREHADGEIQWDSSYEDVDEAIEVMYIVSEELATPYYQVVRVQ